MTPVDVVSQRLMVCVCGRVCYALKVKSDDGWGKVHGLQAGDTRSTATTTRLSTRFLIRQIFASEVSSVRCVVLTCKKKNLSFLQGLAGFFHGYWAGLFTAMPSSAIWWASYGYFRRHLLGQDSADLSNTKRVGLQVRQLD